jgi:hypothetical protein
MIVLLFHRGSYREGRNEPGMRQGSLSILCLAFFSFGYTLPPLPGSGFSCTGTVWGGLLLPENGSMVVSQDRETGRLFVYGGPGYTRCHDPALEMDSARAESYLGLLPV